MIYSGTSALEHNSFHSSVHLIELMNPLIFLIKGTNLTSEIYTPCE